MVVKEQKKRKKLKITFEIMLKVDLKKKRLTGHYDTIIEKFGPDILWIEPIRIATRKYKKDSF